GRARVHQRIAAVAEVKDPAVFEEAIDNRAYFDVLANTGDGRSKGANAAANDIDLHTRLAGPVERLHDHRLQKPVDLGDDPACLARFLERRLLFDFFHHEGLQPARRHDELAPLRQFAIAGQVVEQGRNIFAEVRITGKEAKVGVNARGLRIVI